MAEEKVRVIITVPNQKVVTVKQSICDKEHIYTQCNLKANKMALKELSANAYKLYMYFALNQNDYTFALSYVHVYSVTGMSEKTYHRAVKELIEKGYLVKEENKKNQYIFYDGKIDGEYPLVKNTGQESQVGQVDETEVPDKNGQKDVSRMAKDAGEILQDITLNNTINNSDAPDTNGAMDASRFDADALKEIDFNSSFNFFKNEDIKRIMKATYSERKDFYDDDELVEYLVREFTGSNYRCMNTQAVSNYANYIVYNNITE